MVPSGSWHRLTRKYTFWQTYAEIENETGGDYITLRQEMHRRTARFDANNIRREKGRVTDSPVWVMLLNVKE